METDYSKRELDTKFTDIHKRFDLSELNDEKILKQVTYTNGKLRRVTLVLVIVSSVVVTLLIQNGSPFVNFLIGITK